MEENQARNTILSLTNDAVLKLFFANEANRPQLREFLKATTHLTDDDLKIIEVHNPTLTKENVQDKDFVVDIHLTSVTGHKIIIEMQVENHINFIERMISYSSRRYSTQLQRGEKYTKLRETITLIIVDFPLFDDSDDFYEHIAFRRKNGKLFTNAQQFYIMDLTKLPERLTEAMHQWGALFKMKTEEELKVLMEKSEEMKEAGAKLLKLSADEEARELAEIREFALWAKQREFEAREERGIATGIEKGIEKGRMEERAKAEADKVVMIKRFLNMGLSNEEVAEGVGIDVIDVQKVRGEMKSK